MNITDLLRTNEFDNSLNTFTHQFYDFIEIVISQKSDKHKLFHHFITVKM